MNLSETPTPNLNLALWANSCNHLADTISGQSIILHFDADKITKYHFPTVDIIFSTGQFTEISDFTLVLQ